MKTTKVTQQLREQYQEAAREYADERKEIDELESQIENRTSAETTGDRAVLNGLIQRRQVLLAEQADGLNVADDLKSVEAKLKSEEAKLKQAKENDTFDKDVTAGYQVRLEKARKRASEKAEEMRRLRLEFLNQRRDQLAEEYVTEAKKVAKLYRDLCGLDVVLKAVDPSSKGTVTKRGVEIRLPSFRAPCCAKEERPNKPGVLFLGEWVDSKEERERLLLELDAELDEQAA